MDENGACRFPADKLEAVLHLAEELRAEEADRMGRLQQASSAAELRAIFGSPPPTPNSSSHSTT